MSNIILTCVFERYPIHGAFTIARGSKTCADVICCLLQSGPITGRGECVPYARYGETPQSVTEEIEAIRPLIEAGADHETILSAMEPGAARNAVDCALWDLKAKISGTTVGAMLGLKLHALETAYTLSLGSPDSMFNQAVKNAFRPLLKIKVGSPEKDVDILRMQAVRKGAPLSRIIVDANEGWNERNVADNLRAAADCGIMLVEQPLPAANDSYLGDIHRPVPVCADESLHIGDDLDHLVGLYDAVNIKLDKTGGLTEALRLKKQAQVMEFKIMVGCMVATSLSMAPAVLLAQDADFVDLDGPLLLAEDREYTLRYENARIFPPLPELWG